MSTATATMTSSVETLIDSIPHLTLKLDPASTTTPGLDKLARDLPSAQTKASGSGASTPASSASSSSGDEGTLVDPYNYVGEVLGAGPGEGYAYADLLREFTARFS